MRVGAGRAEVVVGDELHDVGRTELGDSAVGVEGIVVRLESFKSTQGAGTLGRLGAWEMSVADWKRNGVEGLV